MNKVDIKQQELNLVEEAVLTDLFGGIAPENFVYRYGILKFNIAPKVQKFINKFEELVKPVMDDKGYIDTNTIQGFLNEEFIKLPVGKYRLIELYSQYQPYFQNFLSLVKD